MEQEKLRADIPAQAVLYTDVLCANTEREHQVSRDDLWAVSTHDLNHLYDKASTAKVNDALLQVLFHHGNERKLFDMKRGLEYGEWIEKLKEHVF